MIKTYTAPELNVEYFGNDDIMNGSDTIIPVGGLYGEEAQTSSDITVIYEAEEDAAAEAWIAENGMGF